MTGVRHMLVVSTVARSLVLQSPASWPLARQRGLHLTFAAADDGWAADLLLHGEFTALRGSRSLEPAALVRLARDLRALATARTWTLVQIQTPIVAALWRLVAPPAVRRRTVYVAHGLHFQAGDRNVAALAYRLVETALAHRSLGMATVAREDADWLRSLLPPLSPRFAWSLPGAGVDVARFIAAPDDAAVGAPQGRFALFCGDLNANKDPLRAVAAVEAARGLHADLSLAVIGEGPLADELAAAARTRPWLHLIARTQEMERWVKGARVLLAPSRREGVPRVIIESLAAGTPVVAASNRGSRELLSGGVGMILPASAGPEMWAGAIDTALTSPAPAEAMARRAGQYDVAAFEQAYRDLLDTALLAARA